MQELTMNLFFATLILFSQNLFADMDIGRSFIGTKGENITMYANASYTCRKGVETVNYTHFLPKKGSTGCAFTYSYSNNGKTKSNYKTDRLVKLSNTSITVCNNRIEEHLETLKKLGFECNFSGIG